MIFNQTFIMVANDFAKIISVWITDYNCFPVNFLFNGLFLLKCL